MYAAGNPALKMQHWMKNQLAKESYAEQWEDIVRAGAASSVKRNSSPRPSTSTPAEADSKGQLPATGSASASRLPAEFGTSSKVPAKGTAPMGPQDYADGSQWTEREGTIQRRESDTDGAKPDSSVGARDRGYIGGDGANLDGAVRQQATNGAKDLASSSDDSSGRDQEGSAAQAPRKQPQGSTQSPDQASAGAGGNNGAGPISSSGAGPSAASSASSNGSKPDGGKAVSASNDSDWWREVTAASRKNDCSSTGSSLSPKQHQQSGANGSAAKMWNNTEQDKKSVQQNGSASPSSSSPTSSSTSQTSADSDSRSSSPSETVSYGRDASSMHGLEGQSQRASSSNNAPLSPEDKADIDRRTQEVKELASQIENQVSPSMWACSWVTCHACIATPVAHMVLMIASQDQVSKQALGSNQYSPCSTALDIYFLSSIFLRCLPLLLK